METALGTADKKLIRLATAWADLSSAKNAFLLYVQCPDEEMNYHLLLSLVTCYGRPFLRRDGIGPVTDTAQYHFFPDFPNDEMNDHHYYFMALRNIFYAHTTLDGFRLKLIPPNVQYSDKPFRRDVWNFELGVRMFHSQNYKVHVRAAYPVIPEIMTRLEKDIREILQTVVTRYTDATTPFEIDTGAETFDLKQVMTELKKQDRDRQQKSGHVPS